MQPIQASMSTSATGAMGPGPPALFSSTSTLPVIRFASANIACTSA